MGDKLTPKQEKFCHVYIETSNASEAYRQAYNAENMKPESINVNASKLLADAKVALRVQELREEHRKRHAVTIDSLTQELNEAKSLAYQEKQISAGISAIMGKAKIHGFDKVIAEGEVKHVVKIVDLSGKDG